MSPVEFLRGQLKAWLSLLICVFLPLDLIFRLDSLTAALSPWELLVSIAGTVLLLATFSLVIVLALGTVAFVARFVFDSRLLGMITKITHLTVLFMGCYLFSKSLKFWAKSVHLTYPGSPFFIACILFAIAAIVWRSRMLNRISVVVNALQKPLYACICMTAILVATHLLVMELTRESRTANTNHNCQAAGPDIILVTFDSLTTHDMSLYGYHLPTTPQLEQFAKECTVYERAYSISNTTTFAVPSLLTGAFPGVDTGITFFSPYTRIPSAIADRSIPALLKNNGYHTYAVVPMTDFAHPTALGLSHHFDASPLGLMNWSRVPLFHWPGRLSQALRCFGGLYIAERYHIFSAIWLSEYLLENMKTYGHLTHETVSQPFSTPESAVTQAMHLITSHRQSHGKAPFFLWLHFFQPHTPYLPSDDFRGLFLKDKFVFSTVRSMHDLPENYLPSQQSQIDRVRLRYDENIAYADAGFGKLVKELRAHSMLESSMIIVSSDHGESFANRFWGHHGASLAESIINIPLLVKTPGSKVSTRTRSLVSNLDIPATILDAAGIKSPDDVRGVSLINRTTPRDEVICLVPNSKSKNGSGIHMAALIRPPYKLVYDAVLQKPFLYDLERDPYERNNISAEYSTLTGNMFEQLLKEISVDLIKVK